MLDSIVRLGPLTRKKRRHHHEKSMLLLFPPLTKACEPPAALAYLTAALRRHGVSCTPRDLNLEGLLFLLGQEQPRDDTWTKRAAKKVGDHLARLGNTHGYQSFARYSRAVADLNRLVAMAGKAQQLQLSLADFHDPRLSPLASDHLLRSAQEWERNIFFPFFATRLEELLAGDDDPLIGISLGYLSQALCAFALIGYLRARHPQRRIVLGGGLVSTWLARPGRQELFAGLVDHLIAGPGEGPLLRLLGHTADREHLAPEYRDLAHLPYLAPGLILPYSASSGCYWKKCTFCPETSENQRYRPVTPSRAAADLHTLATTERPALIHLLDNSLSPTLLRALIDYPPGAPWYGFVRLEQQLADRDFCMALKKAGCAMLQLGLESGSQAVLDAMGKGTRLAVSAAILANLKEVGIASYVYLLFGTPAEDRRQAEETRRFVEEHHQLITFCNLAIFNLPVGSALLDDLGTSDFYPGDLSIYRDFRHPLGWNRGEVRRYLSSTFTRSPAIAAILRRDPPLFTSNHAPFFASAGVHRT